MVAEREIQPSTKGSFGQLLKYLIDNNIHPSYSDERDPWNQTNLAIKLDLAGPDQVNKWVGDRAPTPQKHFEQMELLFFGKTSGPHEELRKIYKRLYAKAVDTHNRFGNLGLFAQSTVLLLWQELEKNLGLQFDLSTTDIKLKTPSQFELFLNAKAENLDKTERVKVIRDSRALAFDTKYGGALLEEDERHVLGIEDWNDEFDWLLKFLGVDFKGRLVNVGLGPGFEGAGIYERFPEFLGVDLSQTACRRAAEVFPKMEALPGGAAEYLPPVVRDCDVYVSLKTYSSTFFDCDKAIGECARCLKLGGVSIISIPRGYVKDGRLIHGISPTNYDLASATKGQFYGVPDRMLPIQLAATIWSLYYKWLFSDVRIHNGRHEIYVTARKV